MMTEIKNYRDFYNEIVDVRARELDLPEAEKTLKTETFLKIERRINQKFFDRSSLKDQALVGGRVNHG